MPHSFDAECIFLHQRISELHCIPHLDLAVATVQRADRDSDGNVSAIWLFPLDGSEAPRQMTTAPRRTGRRAGRPTARSWPSSPRAGAARRCT